MVDKTSSSKRKNQDNITITTSICINNNKYSALQ